MRKQLFLGVRLALPVSLAVGVYGLVMGVGAAAQDLSWGELLIKSFTVFAGASQFVVVEGWGSPIWVLLLATAAINLRYMMVGLTLRGVLETAPWPLRLAALWYSADENWALTLAQREREPTIGAAFLLGSGLAVLLFWQLGGQIGLAVGGGLPDPSQTIERWGLDFTFAAIFLALTLSFVKRRWDGLPVAAAAAGAIGFAEVLPEHADYHSLYIVGGAIIGCGVAALTYRPDFDAPSTQVLR